MKKAKRTYEYPDCEISLLADIITMSTGGLDSDGWDNKTTGGFDL